MKLFYCLFIGWDKRFRNKRITREMYGLIQGRSRFPVELCRGSWGSTNTATLQIRNPVVSPFETVPKRHVIDPNFGCPRFRSIEQLHRGGRNKPVCGAAKPTKLINEWFSCVFKTIQSLKFASHGRL